MPDDVTMIEETMELPVLHRSGEIVLRQDEGEKASEEDRRTFDVVFSTETEKVRRWYGTEILDHGRGSVVGGRVDVVGKVEVVGKVDVLGRAEVEGKVGAVGKAIVVDRIGLVVDAALRLPSCSDKANWFSRNPVISPDAT